MSTGATTTSVQVAVSVLPFESVTLNVMVNVPVAVGVPLITPVEAFSESPAGSEPDAMENVYAGVPPFAARATEYGVPLVALAAPQVPHWRSSAGAETISVQVAVSEFPFESTTLNVIV